MDSGVMIEPEVDNGVSIVASKNELWVVVMASVVVC